ncbi:MAG: M48 family metallopeptidase [Oligoflexales bacterium]|nr:M48 family metallopeptidase [Oligoflexales bacterium]
MILVLFLVLRIVQHLAERWLSLLNRRYYEDERRRTEAGRILGISLDDMEKTLAYSKDKSVFSSVNSWIDVIITVVFIGVGGLGYFESLAKTIVSLIGGNAILTGLAFFALISVASSIIDLPFDIYYTFVLEQKHGFNKQTVKGFVTDMVKGLFLGTILGGALLYIVLWIMESKGPWWIYAWIAVFGFSLMTMWIYPTLLAPLFNKFTPLEEGELKDKIFALADKVGFKADSISIMDASRRSTHGNAYFTGVFGKKKIVLFDTLVKSMTTDEIVAVLAHELGHFRLHHIRWRLIRSFLITGALFFALYYCSSFELFYKAFSFEGISNYGALVVFSLWFGLIGFLFSPIGSYISRRDEFDADRFALANHGDNKKLGDALLKLREKSHVMPISHPIFSAVYHSHPPLLERLKAMGYI